MNSTFYEFINNPLFFIQPLLVDYNPNKYAPLFWRAFKIGYISLTAINSSV